MIIEDRHSVERYCTTKGIPLHKFNEPVEFADKVSEDLTGLFRNCTSFNQPVIIPDRVKYCNSMFSDCTSFNSPVKLPKRVNDCNCMFSKCTNFNQPIVIPKGCYSVNYMFSMCTSFNQPIEIPKYVRCLTKTFFNCVSLNSQIVIKSSRIKMMDRIFYNCSNLNKDIIFDNVGFCRPDRIGVDILVDKDMMNTAYETQLRDLCSKPFYNCSKFESKIFFIEPQNLYLKILRILLEPFYDAIWAINVPFPKVYEINNKSYQHNFFKHDYLFDKEDKLEYNCITHTLRFHNHISDDRLAKMIINSVSN